MADCFLFIVREGSALGILCHLFFQSFMGQPERWWERPAIPLLIVLLTYGLPYI